MSIILQQPQAGRIESMSQAKNGDLRVWWVPQIPMKSFYVAVNSVEEAALLILTLGRYDLFQFENKVKPDYSNAGGLCIFRDGDWEEWEDDNYNDIEFYVEQRTRQEESLDAPGK